MSHFEKIKTFERKVSRAHAVALQLWPSYRDNIVLLGYLCVPRDNRKAGVGSAVMKDICHWADSNHLQIVLSPAKKNDNMGTTSTGRLVKFYRRFGFVLNNGRHKDFTLSESMYRQPKKVA